MSITKKQHFMPRAAYLRRFSDKKDKNNDYRNKLWVYMIDNEKGLVSSVYDCACKNNLYEYKSFNQNELENLLSSIETDFVTMLDKIISICEDENNAHALIQHGFDEKDNLRFFITLQFFRTEAHRIKSASQEDFLDALVGKDEDGNWKIKKNMEKLESHYFVFVRNTTSVPFVLSDTPVQLYRSENDDAAMFNLILPLTPYLQVLALNPRSNDGIKWRPYRNRIRCISAGEESHVYLSNQKALEGAYRCIYSVPDSEKTNIEYLTGKPSA